MDCKNNMKRVALIILSAIGLSAVGLSARGAVAEEPLRFLHLLQQSGYGDAAVDYLEMMARRPDMPPELRDVWELEMAKSLMAATADAFDEREKEQLLKAAREHLAKFIKEKPDHPAAAAAAVTWGDFLARQAMELVRQAKTAAVKDKDQQEKYLAGARADLKEAREKFQQGRQRYQSQIDAMPPPSRQPVKRGERDEAREARIETEINLQESQLRLAMVEYDVAQTYVDPKSEDRVDALKRAADALDAVYQQNRSSSIAALYNIGLMAHAWHGKTAEESGDHQLALDLYDEVLANSPDPGEKGPGSGMEPLFVQVEYFRLLMLAKQDPGTVPHGSGDVAANPPAVQADGRLSGRRVGTGQSRVVRRRKGRRLRKIETHFRNLAALDRNRQGPQSVSA